MSKRKLLTVILLAFVTTLMLTCAVIFTACRNNETPDDGHNTEQGGENPGGDDAPTEYTITFVADGAVVGTYTYTETDKTISEPSVPVREGYMGIWEDYTLTTGNITVNAIYTPIEYKITFIADGETVDMVTYTVEDKDITEPAVPVKDDYNGIWENYTLTTGDVTVEAVYKPVEYFVVFKADGKEVGTAKYTVEDKDIVEPSVPVKDGYTGVWEDYTLTTGNITVNAVYTPIEYKITFIADGETVDMVTYTVEDKDITEPAVPVKDDYNGIWENYTLTTGDVTVEAVYKPVEYFVVFKADGKEVGTAKYTVEDKDIVEPSVPVKDGYTGVWEDYTIIRGDITVNAKYTAIEYTITFMDDDMVIGSDTYTVEDKEIMVPSVPQKTGYISEWEKYTLTTENITVNVIYTPIEYTITFIADGKTVDTCTYTVEDKDISAPTVPVKAGYSGKWDNYVLTIGNITVNAIYTIIEYTVTFIADGETIGTNTYNVLDRNINEPKVPEKLHYTGSWESYTLTTGNREIHAIYTPIEYKVTFMANQEIVDTVIYTVEEKDIIEPLVPNKIGYTGVWEPYILTNGDKTVYAQYLPIEYTVTFMAGGNVVGTDKYTVEDREIIVPEVPERLGYRGEWEPYTLTTGNIFVNAIYSLIEYSVVFMADGESVSSQTYTIVNNEINEPTVPQKTGYTGKWEYYVLTTGDKIVNAIYTPIEFTVTFVADGNTIATEIYTVEDRNIIEPSVPYKAGYNAVWEPYSLSTGDLTVNAVYTIIEYTITFMAEGSPVAYEKYTVENKDIIEPGVPQKLGYTGAWEDYNLTFGDVTINAVYVINKYYVSITGDEAAGEFTQSGNYDYNSQLTLTAIVNIGYDFSGWYIGDELLSKDSEYVITVPAEATAYIAKFAVLEDMANFEFVSTPTTCKITGVKDKTLSEIIVPDYVTEIVQGAFSGCNRVESIILPFVGDSRKTSTEVYQYPFGYIWGTEWYMDAVIIQQYYHADSIETTTFTSYYIPESLKSVTITDSEILYGAFYNCTQLMDIKIGNNVSNIGDSAFYNCTGIEELVIENGVKSIGKSAFMNCSGLKSLLIPTSISMIAEEAFQNCVGLNEITVLSDSLSIGTDAFSGCDSLSVVYINDLMAWCSFDFAGIESNPLSLAQNLYVNNTLITELSIPAGVRRIGNYAFCNSLISSVSIPNSVNEIGDYAFYKCVQINELNLPNSVTSIGSYSFASCIGITGALSFPVSLLNIGDYAFAECSGIAGILEISSVINNVGAGAFSNCTNLAEIDMTAPITMLNDLTFAYCESLVRVSITSEISSVGASVFEGCSKLQSISLPKSVQSVGSATFKNCTSLTSASFGSKVDSISSYLFYGCVNLINAPIKNTIGDYAFYGCSSISSYNFGNVISIGTYAFYNCKGIKSAYLTRAQSIGAFAFGGCQSTLKSVSMIGTWSISGGITTSDLKDWDEKTMALRLTSTWVDRFWYKQV